MHKHIVLLLTGSILAAGCATTTDEPEAIPAPLPPAPDIGLAMYQPRSDVADLTNAVRHVLNPADPYNSTLDQVVLEPHAQSTRFAPEQTGAVKRVDAPIVVAKLDKVHDPVYEAWRKYCDNADDITQEEWALIDRSEMPTALEAIWADECVPIK